MAEKGKCEMAIRGRHTPKIRERERVVTRVMYSPTVLFRFAS